MKKQLFFNRTNIYIYKAKTKMKNFETIKKLIKKIHCPKGEKSIVSHSTLNDNEGFETNYYPTGGTTVNYEDKVIGNKILKYTRGLNLSKINCFSLFLFLFSILKLFSLQMDLIAFIVGAFLWLKIIDMFKN